MIHKLQLEMSTSKTSANSINILHEELKKKEERLVAMTVKCDLKEEKITAMAVKKLEAMATKIKRKE
ncbi:hypothetical protein AAFF_G00316040 [Aldrovandia affinis]|uniref:Uncharacterized protein n=1 Tax=Aldrovandia affinis TaxID=143900 RepID=A0AAD7SMX0_9TELE|nr:hypothetical protein AAFF_G00316040 [Aldrovandia affinis]